MRAFGVTLEEIFQAVRMSNVDVGSRTIEINRVEYVIQGLGFIKSLKYLEETVIKAHENVPVRIRDVARVSLGPALRRGASRQGRRGSRRGRGRRPLQLQPPGSHPEPQDQERRDRTRSAGFPPCRVATATRNPPKFHSLRLPLAVAVEPYEVLASGNRNSPAWSKKCESQTGDSRRPIGQSGPGGTIDPRLRLLRSHHEGSNPPVP